MDPSLLFDTEEELSLGFDLGSEEELSPGFEFELSSEEEGADIALQEGLDLNGLREEAGQDFYQEDLEGPISPSVLQLEADLVSAFSTEQAYESLEPNRYNVHNEEKYPSTQPLFAPTEQEIIDSIFDDVYPQTQEFKINNSKPLSKQPTESNTELYNDLLQEHIEITPEWKEEVCEKNVVEYKSELDLKATYADLERCDQGSLHLMFSANQEQVLQKAQSILFGREKEHHIADFSIISSTFIDQIMNCLPKIADKYHIQFYNTEILIITLYIMIDLQSKKKKLNTKLFSKYSKKFNLTVNNEMDVFRYYRKIGKEKC